MEYRKSNKRYRSYATRAFMALVVFLAITNYNQVYAAEVASHKEQLESGCTFRVDEKRINFSAYQPKNSPKSLCNKFPLTTGITYFSLDLLDKPLMERALKLKITPVKEGDGAGDGELQTVMYYEVSSSPTGVVSFEHDFEGVGGVYRLDVVNEKDNTQGSFKFEVGAKAFEWDDKFGQKVAFGIFGAFAIFILGYLVLRKKKS